MKENVVSKILFIIGIAQMVVGLLLGLLLAMADHYYGGFVWSSFFAWAIGGFVTGMLFIGFSEVIRLLHSINEKIVPLNSSTVFDNTMKHIDTYNEPKKSPHPVNWSFDEGDKEKIYELYQNENIVDIIPSLLEGHCLVKLENERGQYVRVVDVSGGGASEIGDGDAKHTIISWYNKNES